MEIASYKVLVSAAQTVGDTETATVCGQILREEEAMADWLDKHIEGITGKYLRLEEKPGATAKH
jgi:ferritin-like metal-binding protein YciE